MELPHTNPVVHLELHTGDLPRASAFYAELCGWRPQHIDTHSGSYLALELGGGFGGGIVECGTRRPLWLPYVEVDRVDECTEAVWVDPYPDEKLGLEDGFAGPEARYERRESVELAFIAALQHLPARQRAVLILRDVLGFSGREVAEALGTTPASVYSTLQRAHQTVDERLPEQSQQATLRSLGDGALRDVVDGYVDAWERGDVDAVVAMLTEDATMAMPPIPTWYGGREAVAAFLRGWPLAGGQRWRLVPARANGQAAFGHYIWEAEKGSFTPHGVNVVTLHGARIAEITAFLRPEAFWRFGLPNEIQPSSDSCEMTIRTGRRPW